MKGISTVTTQHIKTLIFNSKCITRRKHSKTWYDIANNTYICEPSTDVAQVFPPNYREQILNKIKLLDEHQDEFIALQPAEYVQFPVENKTATFVKGKLYTNESHKFFAPDYEEVLRKRRK